MEEVIELPCAKKLRYSEPDLKLILTFERSEPDERTKQIYEVYSHDLARLSKFFDIALSVDMKEKATREIVLKDLYPGTFETAMEYLFDLEAARSMTAEFAVGLVDFYAEYQFLGGLKLCDDVLSKYIQQHSVEDIQKAIPKDIDFFMEVLAIARKHDTDMPKTNLQGVARIKDEFEHEEEHPFGIGYLQFSVDHIAFLQPLFKNRKVELPDGITMEDVDNPIFPKYFMQCRNNHFWLMTMRGISLDYVVPESHKVRLEFSLIDGLFQAKNQDWDLESINHRLDYQRGFTLKKDRYLLNNIWVVTYSDTVIWSCPGSSEIKYVPRGPWVPVHSSAEGIYPFTYYGV